MSDQDSPTFLQVRCDDEFKRSVRVAAAKSDKSMSEWVRNQIRNVLTDESAGEAETESGTADT